MKSIRLRKSIMVEGKIISKGARILVENEDIEDVGVPMNPSDNIEDDVDVAKARRLAKIRRIRALKAKKLEGDDEVIDTDENLKPEEFPADEIQALRKARKLRMMKSARKARKAEDEIAEKKARLARIKRMKAIKKAESETIDAETNDKPVDFPADEIQAMRKACLARIRKVKKAEDEPSICDEKCR